MGVAVWELVEHEHEHFVDHDHVVEYEHVVGDVHAYRTTFMAGARDRASRTACVRIRHHMFVLSSTHVRVVDNTCLCCRQHMFVFGEEYIN